jgi:hypothetical protein
MPASATAGMHISPRVWAKEEVEEARRRPKVAKAILRERDMVHLFLLQGLIGKATVSGLG